MANSYRAWRGAIELAGFPINVALYSRVRKQRNESFRMIAPSGQPVTTQLIDPATEEIVERTNTRKGIDRGNDTFAVLTPEAVAAIDSGVKTTVAELHALCPVHTIAWDLAIDRFAVLPDDKVAGSEKSVNVVWNGLRDSDHAYVTQVSLRGGHDAILAIYGDEEGLWAALLPFEEELYEVPAHHYEVDDSQAAMFQQFVAQRYADKVGNFDHGSYESEYRARRAQVIDSVLEGEPVEVPEAAPATDGPDLMAMMAAMAEPAPKAKPKAKKKVAA